MLLQLAFALATLLCATANPFVTNTLCKNIKNHYAYVSGQLLPAIGIKPNEIGQMCPDGLKQTFERLKNTKLSVEAVALYTVCCDSKAPKIYYIEFQVGPIDAAVAEIKDPVTVIAFNRMEFDHPELTMKTKLPELSEKWKLALNDHKFNLCFYAKRAPELIASDVDCKA